MSDLQKQIKSLIAKIEKADPEIIIYIERIELRLEQASETINTLSGKKIETTQESLEGMTARQLGSYHALQAGNIALLGQLEAFQKSFDDAPRYTFRNQTPYGLISKRVEDGEYALLKLEEKV